MARLPVPPDPVMPPEGVGPITDPGADVGGDPLSPTTLVLNYLKQRGYQPSSENVRRAVEANARNPGTIAGLVNNTIDDDGTMGSGTGTGGGAGRSGGGARSGGNVAKKIETSAPPGQSVDKSGNVTAGGGSSGDGGSAAGDGSSLGMQVLAGVVPAALLAGGYAYDRYRGRGGNPLDPGPNEATREITRVDGPGEPGTDVAVSGRRNVADTSASPSDRGYTDVDFTDVTQPQVTGPEARPAIAGPDGRLALPAPGSTPAPPSDMEMAMQRALATPGSSPIDLTGVRPYIQNPAEIIAAGKALPPGVTETDAARAAVGNLNRNATAEALNPPQTVPFQARPGGAPRVPPTPELGIGGGAGDLARGFTRMLRGFRY